MADEYQGRVRFGVVDTKEQEYLGLTFEIFTVPQTFLIKDGMALSIFYDNVRRFIEGTYLEEEKRYTMFPTPQWLVNIVTLYPVYAYRDGLKMLHANQYEIYEWLSSYNLTESEHVKDFFR